VLGCTSESYNNSWDTIGVTLLSPCVLPALGPGRHQCPSPTDYQVSPHTDGTYTVMNHSESSTQFVNYTADQHPPPASIPYNNMAIYPYLNTTATVDSHDRRSDFPAPPPCVD